MTILQLLHCVMIFVVAYICFRYNVTQSNVSIPPPPSKLPPPTAMTLKSIALGIGNQSYSCFGNTVKPIFQGSSSVLYDMRASSVKQEMPAWEIESMKTLSQHVLPTASDTTVMYGYLKASGYNYLGKSVETPDRTFWFFLDDVPQGFEAYIANATQAPTNTYSSKTGAVPWLYIARRPSSNRQSTITAVYRYYTAGGTPPGHCIPHIVQVPYVAQFWIYESKISPPLNGLVPREH
ncbi:hypothetical protein K491DRAFT_680745 [Lophiostoma macrostomum CBS 122681]|uniref:Uncharacterized protein n=1 Tax=Lophiostoma macrostomum CBS 122681 TaxID=1314788 RepID=A0A6A6SZJ6_9PLEO|nr:hypothetical protein K491DRAFT_680745 [Lophiostoma macrostomum CBS 122681]